MEWDIMSLICSPLFIALGTVLLVILIMAFNSSESQNMKLKKHPVIDSPANLKDVSKFTACKSPDCVRCQNYMDVRKSAGKKLQDYLQHHSSQDLVKLMLALGNHMSPRKHTMQNPNVFYLPGISAKPWWNESKNLFADDISLLTKNHKIIADEFNEALKLQHSEDCSRFWSQNDTDSGQWNIFCFYNQGSKMVDNCLECPKTCAVIEQLSNSMKDCIFGNALFSVLHPGTHITEHYGPSNLRVRCHLGLDVPDNCTLTVANETRKWRDGECLLFDDSFLHSAKNGHRYRARVVLMVDLWHPYLSLAEKQALQHIF